VNPDHINKANKPQKPTLPAAKKQNKKPKQDLAKSYSLSHDTLIPEQRSFTPNFEPSQLEPEIAYTVRQGLKPVNQPKPTKGSKKGKGKNQKPNKVDQLIAFDKQQQSTNVQNQSNQRIGNFQHPMYQPYPFQSQLNYQHFQLASQFQG